jgi:hypothetical protein
LRLGEYAAKKTVGSALAEAQRMEPLGGYSARLWTPAAYTPRPAADDVAPFDELAAKVQQDDKPPPLQVCNCTRVPVAVEELASGLEVDGGRRSVVTAAPGCALFDMRRAPQQRA